MVDTPTGEWWFLHFQDRGAYVRERHVDAGERERFGIKDQFGEPSAQGQTVTEDTFEGWCEALEIEQRFIDIEDDEGESGHGGRHLLKHDLEKCAAVFEKDQAQTGSWSGMTIQGKVIPL